MIWFECKQCHKRHGKADNLVGTLVFCECGQGNRVPWSSTVPEPAAEPVEPEPARPESAGRGRPVPPVLFDEDREGVPPRRNRPDPEDDEDEDDWRAPVDAPLPRRKPTRFRRVRAEFCFNHVDDASSEVCADCKLPFCGQCLVQLEGRTLCGPCKNFRVAVLGRPTRTASLAIFALVTALASGPVTMVLSFLAIGLHIGEGLTSGAVAVALVSFLASAVGGVLGWLALRQIDRTPHTGGVSLGTSALSTSAVGMVWSLTLAGYLLIQASR